MEGELDTESIFIGNRPMKDTEHPKSLRISHRRNNRILQLICENGKPEQNKTLNTDNDKCFCQRGESRHLSTGRKYLPIILLMRVLTLEYSQMSCNSVVQSQTT